MDASIEQQIASLGARLAAALATNTATAIGDKVRAAKAKRDAQETINELVGIINGLIADKDDLAQIAHEYQEELVAQRITEDEIEYITTNLIPILKDLAKLAPNNKNSATPANTEQALDALARLLSVETLTVLQLVGFNYKKAIGEPLTLWVQKLITSKIPADPQINLELQKASMLRSIEAYKLAQNQEASERLEQMRAKGLL
jgi:hypothetical protein